MKHFKLFFVILMTGLLLAGCSSQPVAAPATEEGVEETGASIEPETEVAEAEPTEPPATAGPTEVPATEAAETASNSSGYPRTVVDGLGQKTTINSAERIIVVHQVVSSIVSELEAYDRVVGREEYSTFPPEDTEGVPTIGPYDQLDAEGILSLKPDLMIITDRHMGLSEGEANRAVIEQVRSAGVTILVLPQLAQVEANGGDYSLDIMIDHVRVVADALNVIDKGAKVIAEMQSDAEKAAAIAAKIEKPVRVLAVGYTEPDGSKLWAQNGGMTNDLVIRMAGGENVLGDEECCFTEVDAEGLVALAPDVIMVVDVYIPLLSSTDPLAAFTALPGVADTPAGRNGAIYVVNEMVGYGSTPMLSRSALGLAEFMQSLDDQSAADYPRIVVDALGQKTTINSAERIIVIEQAMSSIVSELDAYDRVVGREEYAIYPLEDTEGVPTVGTYDALDAEGILSLKPDLLIIADTEVGLSEGEGNRAVIEQVRSAGVAVLVVPQLGMVEANEGTYDLDIMIHHVRLVAEALAIEEKGAEVIAQMQRDAEKVATVVGKVDKPLRILALGWVEPDGSQMWGQGSGMTNDLVIRMAGGENILAEQGCCFHEVNPESLVAMAPDVIMVVDTFIEPLSETDPVAAFAALPGVADTPAGRNKAIYIVSEWLGYGATPMLPKAALGLAEFIETVKQ